MSGDFDAAAFKEGARRQWQQAAEAWYRWTPTLVDWQRPVTDVMMAAASITEGQRVLDVAAGAGEPAVTIAKRVGKKGSVVASDISAAILEFAERRARDQGVSNLTTRVADGEALALPEASFDAAVSRLGLIYFPDRVGALKQIRHLLKDGARVAVVGITSPAANPFSAITMRIIAQRAALPPPRAGMPGPFSLGTDALMRDALASAGFADIEVSVVGAPLELPSGTQCARFQREAFAGLDQLLGKLPPADRDQVWEEIGGELQKLSRDGKFRGDAQFIVGSGAKRAAS